MVKVKKPIVTENEDLKKEFTYPDAMEFDTNRPLIIGVQGPYELIVLDEKTYVISTRHKERLMKGDTTKEDLRIKLANSKPFYDPFKTFSIEQFINTIVTIDLNDSKSILEFYNSYGPLGFDGMGTAQEASNSSLIRTFGMHLDTFGESLAFFKTRINELKDTIQLHEAIQDQDVQFLRKFPFKSKIERESVTESTPKETLLLYAKRQIMQVINSNSHLINPVIGLTDGEITKFTTATCLLGVFYLRLYELVTENPKIKKCHYCGDYFIPRKANANFCPPAEANEKSRCARNYDAMVRRIAKWHYEEGLTLEEVQQKLTKPKSRSIKEIQYILDNYKGKLKK